jgi:hypothetical protein
MSITKKDLKMMQLEREEQSNTITKEYVECGHTKPNSRREFLNSGLIAMGGALFLPTFSQLISQSAWGQSITCPDASGGGISTPAFINIQLCGGSANFANFIARGPNGDALTDYEKLGMGFAPRVENLFSNGAPFWINPGDTAGASGFAQGLLKVVPRANDIHSKTAFVAVAAESVDDRATNPQDLSGMLQAGGFIGSSLPYLLTGYGAFLTETLVPPTNQFVGGVIPSANFLKVETKASISSSLNVKGALGTMSAGMPQKLIKAIEDLNKLQVEALASDPKSHESQKIFKQLMTCASEKNTSILGSASIVDIYDGAFPTNAAADAALQVKNIWAKNKSDIDGDGDNNAQLRGKGLNKTLMHSVLERTGLAVSNCIRGFSGAALVNLGGYDYHSAFYTRASAELKDKFVGDIVGRILMTAKAFNRPVFIYITADGSVNNQKSASPEVDWSGDYPKRAINYILAYKPTGAPTTAGVTVGSYSDASYQLNHFSSAHVVGSQNPIGSLDAQDLTAAAVFLNYLNFAGKGADINSAKLAAVKKRLQDSLPSGTDIMSYYTRIK